MMISRVKHVLACLEYHNDRGMFPFEWEVLRSGISVVNITKSEDGFLTTELESVVSYFIWVGSSAI